MKWFQSKFDDRVKFLATDIVTASVERSRLSFQLLSVEPKMTDMEMAALWVMGVIVMQEAQESEEIQAWVMRTKKRSKR
jgi:hypothetical protein